MVKYKTYGWLEVLLPGQTLVLTAIPSGLLMPVYQEFEILAASLWYCFWMALSSSPNRVSPAVLLWTAAHE